jgi:hypothetical protein
MLTFYFMYYVPILINILHNISIIIILMLTLLDDSYNNLPLIEKEIIFFINAFNYLSFDHIMANLILLILIFYVIFEMLN